MHTDPAISCFRILFDGIDWMEIQKVDKNEALVECLTCLLRDLEHVARFYPVTRCLR